MEARVEGLKGIRRRDGESGVFSSALHESLRVEDLDVPVGTKRDGEARTVQSLWKGDAGMDT